MTLTLEWRSIASSVMFARLFVSEKLKYTVTHTIVLNGVDAVIFIEFYRLRIVLFCLKVFIEK